MDYERLGTTAVKERISYCMGLSAFVNDGDRESSWDGNINVYPNDIENKAELLGRVPIQVKGTGKSVDAKAVIVKHRVEVSDLRNYYRDGGVIFFVVVINQDRSKMIFYASILPYDIHHILKKGQTTKATIILNLLPESDDDVRRIFLAFIDDRKRQATKFVLTEEQADAAMLDGGKINLHITPKTAIQNDFDTMRELTTQPFYLYAQSKEGVEFPFGKVDVNSNAKFATQVDIPIKINGGVYFSHYTVMFEVEREMCALVKCAPLRLKRTG